MASEKLGLSIGELANAFGVTPDTIRFYEKRGLLRSVPRGENGYRQYGFAEFDQLSGVFFLRNLGVPLDSIREHLRASDVDSSLQLLRDVGDKVETEIRRLQEGVCRLNEQMEALERLQSGIGRTTVSTFPLRTAVTIQRGQMADEWEFSVSQLSEFIRSFSRVPREKDWMVRGRLGLRLKGPSFDTGDVVLVYSVATGEGDALPAGSYATRVVRGSDPGDLETARAGLLNWVRDKGHPAPDTLLEIWQTDNAFTAQSENWLTEYQILLPAIDTP